MAEFYGRATQDFAQVTSLEVHLLRPESLPGWRKGRMRKELLAYCARDTLALVRIHEWLVDQAAG